MLGVLLRRESRASRSVADGGASDAVRALDRISGVRGAEGDGDGDEDDDGALTPRPTVDLALWTVEEDT